ncbi:U-box domain-containing protein [Chloropicon primus]|nr:U-box domain-containing protein [Chloropicon primus]
MEELVDKAVEREGMVLCLTQHALKQVPAKVFSHLGLVELDLSRNSIVELAPSIQVLKSLQVLKLSWNGLTNLPKEVCRLKKLKMLYLQFNNLTFLPEDLGNLENLAVLQANDNKIHHVPESVSKLGHLSELNLEYNQIQILPNTLHLAGTKNPLGLGALKLRGNPLLYPSQDVIVEGTRAVLEFLRKQSGGQTSGVRRGGQEPAKLESPECLKAKGGVSFYVQHRNLSSSVRNLRGGEEEQGGDGSSERPGPNTEKDKYAYLHTDLHREVEELIAQTRETFSMEGGGPSDRSSRHEPGSSSSARAAASSNSSSGTPHECPSPSHRRASPAKIHNGRTLFTSGSSPAIPERSRVADLRVTPAPSPGKASTASGQDNEARGRQSSFARSFYEHGASRQLRGMDLGECITVNGKQRKVDAQPQGPEDVSQQAEGAQSYSERTEPAGDATPGAPPAVTEEDIDIVHQLLAQRNPGIAYAMRGILYHTEVNDEDDNSSIEDEMTPESLSKLVEEVRGSPSTSPPRASPRKDLPKEFFCPITHDLMKDPVVLSDGHTYERKAIEKWIKLGKTTSPMTGVPLQNMSLTPNFTLRSMLQNPSFRTG